MFLEGCADRVDLADRPGAGRAARAHRASVL